MAELLNQIIPDVVARSDQLWRAFWETIQMVGISGAISLVFGIPYGVLLFTTREGGVLQNRPVNFILGRVCDFFRSIPFILLAILLLGLSRLVVGVAIGVRGAIIPLVFGTVPFLGRQTESALAEVPAGLIEAAEAIGSSPWEIIWRVYLREAVPGITRGVTITIVSLINFTAVAGTLGAGGLGNFAIMYGHSKNLPQITWTVILIIVVLVSAVQFVGGYIVKKATH